MGIVQDSAQKWMVPVPPLIVYSFDVPQYKETSNFAGLEDCPNTVANVFLDYVNVSDMNCPLLNVRTHCKKLMISVSTESFLKLSNLSLRGVFLFQN